MKKTAVFLASLLISLVLLEGSIELLESSAQEMPFLSGPPHLASEEADALLRSLPADNFSEGWVQAQKPRLYGKDDLFELIDGEAEQYFQFGFLNAASGIYTNKREADSLLTVDIFEMADKLMAFGLYSTYRSSGSAYHPLGTESFGDSGSLYGYQGKFVVRIYCASLKTLKSPVTAAALSLFASLPGDRSPPAELSLLPAAGKVAHSEKLTMKGFLGIDEHPAALEAEYKDKGHTFKGFIITSPDEKKNLALFEKLLGLLDRKSLKKKPAAGGTAYYSKTRYNEGLCLYASGSLTMGAFMLESFDEGLRFISMVKAAPKASLLPRRPGSMGKESSGRGNLAGSRHEVNRCHR
ncbi:MAG: hypothetical protein RDV48_15200 [Candidatus Eremiobacteraeota bacterium]|nr:hypothetical protein [Candidatus Eremiobacteraeota bacterium]